ncbi:MAG: DUF86 domain-containing protein [Bacteroidetes bacterium]|jgi:uncharacterized protein YutE (UPF0331/DUF86 family)|nr:DUF86 domain-containing protein [Bacteroidota bacterium]
MDGVRGKLKELEDNLDALQRFEQYEASDLQQDRRLRWALRYGFLESIQRVIDVARAVVSLKSLGYPKSYDACIRMLRDADLLPEALATNLVKAVGLRNILVHDCLEVDDGELLRSLDQLDDLRTFVSHMAPHLA